MSCEHTKLLVRFWIPNADRPIVRTGEQTRTIRAEPNRVDATRITEKPFLFQTRFTIEVIDFAGFRSGDDVLPVWAERKSTEPVRQRYFGVIFFILGTPDALPSLSIP